MEGRFANDTMAREVRCRTVALKFTANYGAHANITIHMKIALYEGDRPFHSITDLTEELADHTGHRGKLDEYQYRVIHDTREWTVEDGPITEGSVVVLMKTEDMLAYTRDVAIGEAQQAKEAAEGAMLTAIANAGKGAVLAVRATKRGRTD